MSKTICVYCASSNNLSDHYKKSAQELGIEIGRRGYTLVYGGTLEGLMGIIAQSVKKSGGKVIAVIPELLHRRHMDFDESDQVIVTPDMRERKAIMQNRAEAFVVLPGGFGTMDEVMEQIALKQLGYHKKPIIFVNTEGFYETLYTHFEKIYTDNFAHPSQKSLYTSADTIAQVMELLGE